MNERGRMASAALLSAILIATVAVSSWGLGEAGIRADFAGRLLRPSAAHPFGTDQMGRDLLARSMHGLALSLQVGALAAGLSVVIALGVTLVSGFGGIADSLARFVTDLMLAMPHLMLLLLLSFMLGGGTAAVIFAVAVSHWPRLARVLRGEPFRSNPPHSSKPPVLWAGHGGSP